MQTSVLFIHPTASLDVHKPYSQACSKLAAQGHRVVFAYNGPEVDGLADDVPIYNFNTWAKQHHGEIDGAKIVDVEARYPRSNLWRAMASERRYTNYSLLDGTYPMFKYSFDELNYYLKAMVLFYEHIIEKHGIEVMVPHHPDNVHSTLLFEMARSINMPAFLIFPDFYWSRSNMFMFDSLNFVSTPVLTTYQRNMADYDNLVAHREEEAKAYIEARLKVEPTKTRPDAFPKVSIFQSIKNALETIRRGHVKLYMRKPPIIDSFSQLYLPASAKAFFLKHYHALRLRTSGFLASEVPKDPFVFFPLQRVPEAAMLSRATSYLNQQGLLQSISASLPAGYKLVVKDHPRNMGMHSVFYYKKLLQLPNVVVMQPGYSNHELLEKCSLVITIGGTLGYQQLMRCEPVIMFGRKFYEIIDGVIRVEDPNELPYLLKDILLNGVRPDAEQMRRSLYSFLVALFDRRHIAEGLNNVTLKSDPQALAKVLDDMLQKDLAEHVERYRRGERLPPDNMEHVNALPEGVAIS